MNFAAHQEKERNEKTGKRRAGEDEDKRLILKRLRVTLLRSFKGQHGEKNGLCEGSSRGKWAGRLTAISIQPKWGCMGPHHYVEAAVDWCSSILLA